MMSERTGRAGAPESETVSFIGSGMQVVGNVDCAGVIKVAGTVLGNVNAARQVLVTRGGKVDGDVHAHEAVVDGEISDDGALILIVTAEIS